MIDYPLATSSWGQEEINAIHDVIASDIYSMGKHVEEYEKKFARYFNSKYAVMASSGSAANLLMIASLLYTKKPLLKKGDEVIVPAVSWSTTYFPLQQLGLKLKFVDIDLKTLNINIESLESAITDSTKAILAVNLLGNICDFNRINKLINDRSIILLEDNCESMGAMLGTQHAGTFGIMGTFSTFFSHHISTMEGGCILTNNEELYHVLLCLRAHGWTRNLPEKNLVSGIKDQDPFKESFKFVLPGYNLRPLEMSGAIGLVQLQKFSNFLSKRRENASYFKELFFDNDKFIIQKETGLSSWFGFSLVARKDFNIKRSIITNKLISNGIECRPIVAGNFVKNKVIKYFEYQVHDSLEIADHIHNRGFFVGNHHYNLKKQISKLHHILSRL